jgi:hypothetical protein
VPASGYPEVLVRRVAIIVFSSLAAMALFAAVVSARHSNDSDPRVVIYDPNPAHLWNRVYATLLVREDKHRNRFGEDSLQPPLWPESEHLLSEPSHKLASQVLDEFLRTHGETLVHDPVKRAVFLHDLWAVFDWSVAQSPARDRPQYNNEKKELQARLAEVLRRLALTPDEIKSLPDNYAQAVASGAFAKQYDPAQPEQAFLPPDLFDPHGPWVCIQPSPEGFEIGGVAKMHVAAFSGRSGFLVFVRLPNGRKATMDYFQSLWDFPQPWIHGPSIAEDQAIENPDLPSFPAGTQVALVRRMTLFDNQGNVAASSITESVQLRVYHAITTMEERNFGNGNMNEVKRNSGQDFFEIKFSRPLLFSGRNGGLRAVARDEKEFSTFQSQGDDPFEGRSLRPKSADTPPELQTCVWCHSGGGVRSLNSRDALLKPNRRQQEPQNVDYGPIYWSDDAAVGWKGSRFDWGLLNGYWKAAPQQ